MLFLRLQNYDIVVQLSFVSHLFDSFTRPCVQEDWRCVRSVAKRFHDQRSISVAINYHYGPVSYAGRRPFGFTAVFFSFFFSPIVSVPFRSRFALLTTMTWLYHVLGPRVMVRAVSASRHPRFGTCYRLISRTVMLVANSSSPALVQAYS